ncbi:complex I assembly factor ACAD9, mitochondrial-like [Ylistrum balloti]|uniref:complex I assembly factor ACAD9, mitochondrial-like n=1 Tax=Ylistrum balloti TaxID=509963 RepID=UPI002905F6EC|nr:complex I assembly factor ACAD9, mitochondrial-like [Ylistrum balloti]
MFSKTSLHFAKSTQKCHIFKTHRIFSSVRWCANQVASQTDSPVYTVEDNRPITNVPFAKNLFVGKLDKAFLAYPTIPEDELNDLNQMVQPIEKYFEEALDSKSIDVNAKISEETLQEIKDLGLFGQQIPEEHGGLGLNATKFARLAEITALDGSVAVTLAAHQSIGLKGILIAGNDQQKEKYLPKLATGENIAAFCLTEPSSGSDAASIQTKATLSEDGKTFYLNGGKIWISNGGIAEIFTVFAKTEVEKDGKKVDKVTAFIVERSFGGVTSGKPEDKLGIRGSNTCEVHFDNTPVPIENVLGEVGGGFKVAMNILNSGRFSMGSSGAGILKKLIAMTAEHAISRKQFGKHLSEFRLIKEKFAKMAVTTYAMESMAYWTAGIIDQYQQPDCSLEAAMVKIFSSEGCWVCVNECLQILGGLGYMKDYPYERYLRDGRILMIFEGTNEILRMFVALNGLQFAGKALKEQIKVSNILTNPSTLLRMYFETEPKLTMKLHEGIHPTLKPQADMLEKYTLHLQRAVVKILSKYKKEVVDQQIHQKRMADIAIDLFGMTACIARTSRSYCIGLKNSDHEVMLTKAFCYEARERIEQNLKDLRAETFENNDDTLESIADTIFKNHGYAASHPLDRNW